MDRFAIAAVCALLLTAAAGGAAAETTLLWSELLDGGGSRTDVGRIGLVAADGNLVVAGETTERIGGAYFTVRKQSAVDGSEMWRTRVPSSDASDMFITDLKQDAGGDLIVAGYIGGCGGT